MRHERCIEKCKVDKTISLIFLHALFRHRILSGRHYEESGLEASSFPFVLLLSYCGAFAGEAIPDLMIQFTGCVTCPARLVCIVFGRKDRTEMCRFFSQSQQNGLLWLV
jgi:hypothetical protein